MARKIIVVVLGALALAGAFLGIYFADHHETLASVLMMVSAVSLGVLFVYFFPPLSQFMGRKRF